MKHYDYIFTGAGLSALMTVYKMVQSGSFTDKSILLLDENTKKTTELGVSGKLTIHFWEQSFKKMGFCLPTKTFAGI
jgi:lycopene beta-cyclase